MMDIVRFRKATQKQREAMLEKAIIDTRSDQKHATATLNNLVDLIVELRKFDKQNRT